MKIEVKCTECFRLVKEDAVDLDKSPLPMNLSTMVIFVDPHNCEKKTP